MPAAGLCTDVAACRKELQLAAVVETMGMPPYAPGVAVQPSSSPGAERVAETCMKLADGRGNLQVASIGCTSLGPDL